MPPFWISIALLSIVQGALVALGRPLAGLDLSRLRGRAWAAVPPHSPDRRP